MPASSNIGILGISSLSESVCTNIVSRGQSVLFAVEDTEKQRLESFVSGIPSEKGFDNSSWGKVSPYTKLKDFFQFLSCPRKLFVFPNDPMSPGATPSTEEKPSFDVFSQIAEYLDPGDVVIYATQRLSSFDVRRAASIVMKNDISFVDVGFLGEISENNASILVGGSIEAFQLVESILLMFAAKTTDYKYTSLCHFGDVGTAQLAIQLHRSIASFLIDILTECFVILLSAGGFSLHQIQTIFEDWYSSNTICSESSKTKKTSAKLSTFDTYSSGTLGYLSGQNSCLENNPIIHCFIKSLRTSSLESAGQLNQVASEMAASLKSLELDSVIESKSINTTSKKNALDPRIIPKVGREQLSRDVESSIIAAFVCFITNKFEELQKITSQDKIKVNLKELLRVWSCGSLLCCRLIYIRFHH